MTKATIEYELIGETEDFQCMSIFAQSLDLLDNCRKNERIAALEWMSVTINNKLKDLTSQN